MKTKLTSYFPAYLLGVSFNNHGTNCETEHLEISAPQLCNSTTPPPAEEGLVVTPQPEAPTCVDPSSDEVLDSVEEVLIALERHITRYVDVHAPHRFTRFTIATKRATEHELHVIIEERV